MSDYLRDERGLPLNVGFAVARKARSQRLLEVTVLSCDRGIRTQGIPKRQVLLPESAIFFNEMNVIRAWLTAAKELVVRNAPVTAVLVPCPLEERHTLVDRCPTGMTGQDVEHGFGAESRDGGAADMLEVQGQRLTGFAQTLRFGEKQRGPAFIIFDDPNRTRFQPERILQEKTQLIQFTLRRIGEEAPRPRSVCDART